MHQAAEQLREETGPISADARPALARLLEAVADAGHDAGTYVHGGASAVANALLAQPLDQSIVDAIARERDGRDRFEREDPTRSS